MTADAKPRWQFPDYRAFFCKHGGGCGAGIAVCYQTTPHWRTETDIDRGLRVAVCELGWFPVSKGEFWCTPCWAYEYTTGNREAEDANVLRTQILNGRAQFARVA